MVVSSSREVGIDKKKGPTATKVSDKKDSLLAVIRYDRLNHEG